LDKWLENCAQKLIRDLHESLMIEVLCCCESVQSAGTSVVQLKERKQTASNTKGRRTCQFFVSDDHDLTSLNTLDKSSS
jgi:hypothetical protein